MEEDPAMFITDLEEPVICIRRSRRLERKIKSQPWDSASPAQQEFLSPDEENMPSLRDEECLFTLDCEGHSASENQEEGIVLSKNQKEKLVLSMAQEEDSVLSENKEENSVLSENKEENSVLSKNKEENSVLSENKEENSVLSENQEEDHVLFKNQEDHILSNYEKEGTTLPKNHKKKSISKESQKSNTRSSRRQPDSIGISSKPQLHKTKTTTSSSNHVLNECPLFKSPPGSVSPKRKGGYMVEEDLDILQYIDAYEAYTRLGGTQVWKEMEKNFGYRRSWQSLKERFRKRIMTNVDAYVQYDVSPSIVTRFQSKVEVKLEPKKERGKRTEFTFDEDLYIIRFISKNIRYHEISGVLLWQEMESMCDELSNHTWQSLKNRFLKKILPNIKQYGLSSDEIIQFKSKRRLRPQQWKRGRSLKSVGTLPPSHTRKWRKSDTAERKKPLTKKKKKPQDKEMNRKMIYDSPYRSSSDTSESLDMTEHHAYETKNKDSTDAVVMRSGTRGSTDTWVIPRLSPPKRITKRQLVANDNVDDTINIFQQSNKHYKKPEIRKTYSRDVIPQSTPSIESFLETGKKQSRKRQLMTLDVLELSPKTPFRENSVNSRRNLRMKLSSKNFLEVQSSTLEQVVLQKQESFYVRKESEQEESSKDEVTPTERKEKRVEYPPDCNMTVAMPEQSWARKVQDMKNHEEKENDIQSHKEQSGARNSPRSSQRIIARQSDKEKEQEEEEKAIVQVTEMEKVEEEIILEEKEENEEEQEKMQKQREEIGEMLSGEQETEEVRMEEEIQKEDSITKDRATKKFVLRNTEEQYFPKEEENSLPDLHIDLNTTESERSSSSQEGEPLYSNTNHATPAHCQRPHTTPAHQHYSPDSTAAHHHSLLNIPASHLHTPLTNHQALNATPSLSKVSTQLPIPLKKVNTLSDILKTSSSTSSGDEEYFTADDHHTLRPDGQQCEDRRSLNQSNRGTPRVKLRKLVIRCQKLR